MLVDKRCLNYYRNCYINFPNEDERFLASEISYYEQKYGIITPADFYTYLNDKEKLLVVLKRALDLDLDSSVEDKTLLDYIGTLRNYQIMLELNRLGKELKDTSDVMIKAQIAQKMAKIKLEIKD